MRREVGHIDLQMRIADEMQTEGWGSKTDGERLQEATRRLKDAIRRAYLDRLGLTQDEQEALPPDQGMTCTGQLIFPGM